jgi:hypothetical protein
MGAMWRELGILVLALSLPQDLDRPFTHEEHEFSIRPPKGWVRGGGQGAFFLRFQPTEELKSPCLIEVAHLPRNTNPTPLASFIRQVKDQLAKDYKGHQILEEKEMTIAGKPAFRLVLSHGDALHVKTVVHRTNLEWYLVDGRMGQADAAKFRPAVEASAASFEIRPRALSVEESAAFARTMEVLRRAKILPALLGEHWHSVYLGAKKAGHQRTRVTESEGMYALEVDVALDFLEGGKDQTIVRGSFSPDARTQKVDTEQTKTHGSDRWQFRASAVLENGRVRAARDLNGHKEERSFAAEDGVLFTDVADLVRRLLAGAAPGDYLLKTLSPFVDEWNAEPVEVNAASPMELDGRKVEAHVVFAKPDRRRNQTYYYGTDRALLRFGGVKDLMSLRAGTREEALKP